MKKNLWNNFIFSWITSRQTGCRTAEKTMLSFNCYLYNLQMQCHRWVDFCSMNVVVCCIPTATIFLCRNSKRSHVLGLEKLFQPYQSFWVNVPSTVTLFPAQLGGAAETSIEVSTTLQVPRASCLVMSTFCLTSGPALLLNQQKMLGSVFSYVLHGQMLHNCYSSGEWSCNEQQESCLRPPIFTYCKWHASFFPCSPFEATLFQSI